ncbi:Mbov_0401 family ICE element transposase-like protein [Mycoplasma enhydrae]|uniref:Mbov_0401 family ICE element transposase-like protein n=1 Tax=Mycoplasma enhydrae TaxID=2499220 RepID=UPI00197BCBAA|nr:UPF0236 family protein [Mycoplasma enhydrae]MBN4089695.1 UPF0236 family protein [Mycoplasma enhydrae]
MFQFLNQKTRFFIEILIKIINNQETHAISVFWFRYNLSMNLVNHLKEELIKEDEMFFWGPKRKKEGWKVKDWIIRRLKHLEGEINVKIRRYYRKIENRIEYYNVFNTKFRDEKRKSITLSLKESAYKFFLKGLSYRAIADCFSISHSTIFNYVKANQQNTLKNMQFMNYSQIAKTKKTIYISVDDTYFKIKENKCHTSKQKARMINFFLLDENKKPIAKNHLIMMSKPLINTSISSLAKKILAIIKNFYSSNLRIIITGDGAKWIRTLAKLLDAKQILCKFHLAQKLRVIFNNSKELRMSLNNLKNVLHINLRTYIYDCIKNHNYLKIYAFVAKNWNEIYHFLDHNRCKLLYDFAKYIKLNLAGLEEIKNDDYLYYGNIAESYVSHLVKSKIKRHFAIYSLNTVIQKIIGPTKNQKNNIIIENLNI